MGDPAGWRPHLGAFAGYTAAAAAFTWPLPAHFATHLTGSPAGDTGVYAWNQWVFRHELLAHGRLPYFTDAIFAMHGGANLSLHNYTPFQNLVALPFQGWLGVVPTFNLVYLLMTILTGYAAFLLARHVTGRTAESWLAGLLFAWSPILATRGGGHFSLVAAAPLAVFLLLLLRAVERQRLRDAVALGAAVWWAGSTDAYYGVYCLMIAGLLLLGRLVTVRPRPPAGRARSAAWALDVLILCVGGLVISTVITGGWEFTIFGRLTTVRTLYTPMLVLTVLGLLRAGMAYRPSLVPVTYEEVRRLARVAAVATVCTVVLLSPVLYAVGVRVADGMWESSDRIFWRTSPGGVDLLAYVLPNPNHPFAPAAIREWLTPRPDAYYENVASLTFVALATIAVAWRGGWQVPRLWGGLALVFGALALGPFVHVAGVNTYIPGPWALLRYLPAIGAARSPGRFSIVLMLAVAVVFACALAWVGRRWPDRRPAIIAAAGALLAFELLPVPRPLFPAAVPGVYGHVAAAPHDARLLELPFGIRDGTSSVGDFTARSQFYQTMHGKPLFGGYMSRVPRLKVRQVRSEPMLDALVVLSEGGMLDPARARALVETGPEFVERSRLGFVAIDATRTSDALREFAIRALRLQLIDSDGPTELYRPAIARDAADAPILN